MEIGDWIAVFVYSTFDGVPASMRKEGVDGTVVVLKLLPEEKTVGEEG